MWFCGLCEEDRRSQLRITEIQGASGSNMVNGNLELKSSRAETISRARFESKIRVSRIRSGYVLKLVTRCEFNDGLIGSGGSGERGQID